MYALVVGASGLLGRSISAELGRAGYELRLHAHGNGERGERLVRELHDTAPAVELVLADLLTTEGPRRLIDGIERLDLLVYAAGAYRSAAIEDLRAEEADEIWALNVRAPLLVIHHALPALRRARGQVIVLSDVAGQQAWRRHAAYAASKAGLDHLVRCLALELAPDIRVNAVSPGLVRGASAANTEAFETLRSRIPLGRAVEADEVARTVRLLAEAPPVVTGQRVAVDGGRSLGRKGD